MQPADRAEYDAAVIAKTRRQGVAVGTVESCGIDAVVDTRDLGRCDADGLQQIAFELTRQGYKALYQGGMQPAQPFSFAVLNGSRCT